MRLFSLLQVLPFVLCLAAGSTSLFALPMMEEQFI